ncbi:MAG TPA: DUF5916 domain-containing protein [Gemmatimonadaceae bacterium]|nr:DUF5916 domain-containing protein [Gemmatimonadaceae bacterium]
MLRSLLCLPLVFALPLAAQDTPARAPYDHQRDAPVAEATRATSPIRINGVLDEPAWREARPITELVQLDPSEGQPVSERTEVRILYDEDALYVGAMLYDRSPVSARLGRRDISSMSASDWLTLIFDSNHDHRTSFGFEVNPAGVRRDQARSPQGEDDSWDPVWEAVTTVTDSGWIAEIRIPFSQFRFTRETVQTWGFQVERQIARNQEFALWPFTPRDEPGGIPRYGHLTGLQDLATGKRLEIMPYAVTRAEYVDRGANPFRTSREFSGDVGLDLKYRVSSNLTLDATVNPDFGQVEVDPAVINLTAFETIFAERRPFFIEGAELFSFGQDGSNSVFYSRRIGRQPSLSPQFAARDVPDQTRILGAVKLAGRTTGGWSSGILNAVTRREVARFQTPEGETGEIVAEPLTNYFVGRVRRETRAGQTAIGGFAGAVNRDLEGETLPSVLRSAAYTSGADLFHQWRQRTWTLQGYVVGSHVRGEREVITATQRLPYHYFQRPDADHLSLDTNATTLTGFAARLNLARRVGRNWSSSLNLNTISPKYEVSDLGFQRRADRIDAQVNLNYNESRPGTVLRRYSMYAAGLVEHNYGWENISNRLFTGGSLQLLNYWQAFAELTFSQAGTVDDRLTRGGPAAYRPGFVSMYSEVVSDQRKRLVGSFGSFLQRGPGEGSNVAIFANLTIRPASHWDVSIGPQFSHDFAEAQYLQRVADPAATHTFGARYVFAGLEQKTLAIVTRMNYTFTPGLSLQVYAQPLIASGDFGPPKEFAAPGRFEFQQYGTEVGEIVDDRIYPTGQESGGVSFAVPQPNFNVASLRGNAVLRWEWRPGSTLYLAWQQTRSDFQPVGDFDLGRDFDALFAASPDNILLLKVSYWLNP